MPIENETLETTKPCFFCGLPAPATFDPEAVFNQWVDDNQIMSSGRSRFDDVRDDLQWASLDESDQGCHPLCALKWAVAKAGFSERYPVGVREI